MTEQRNKMTVADIEREKGRTKLYAAGEIKRLDQRYYILAKEDEKVEIGDVVVYEDGGVNFGWFVSVVSKSTK